jgi:DNA-binding MarR family transcriptional regulator
MLKVLGPRHPVVALIDELVRTHGRLKGVFANVNDASGLSSMESTVLAAVVEAPSPPTVPQIGRSLGYSRQVIQRAANVLMERGLVEAAPNPSHKRAVLLLPTNRGRKLKKRAEAHAIDEMEPLLRSIDSTRCHRVAGELRELRGEIEAYLRTEKKKP